MADDERRDHATFRELKATEDALTKRMSAIELEQATTREKIAHLPDDIRELKQSVQSVLTSLPRQPTQAADPNVLAMHHAASAMTEAVKAMANRPSIGQELAHALAESKAIKNGSVWPWFVAGVAVAAAAPMVWHQLTGH